MSPVVARDVPPRFSRGAGVESKGQDTALESGQFAVLSPLRQCMLSIGRISQPTRHDL